MCGTYLKNNKKIILNDLRGHDDYISCDSETLSEIEISIFMDENIVAVLAIDSTVVNGFEQIDKGCLGKLLSMI